MKPYWEVMHDCWMDDIRFDLEQIWAFKLMLRKHIHDDMAVHFRELIAMTNKHLDSLLKEYKKVYGDRPNITRMRKEIERE